MKIKIYKRYIRLHFDNFDLILYRWWPYRIRKVVYPSGTHKMAAGAFSFNRSPSERRHAHENFLLWDAEIRRRYAAEGADGVVVGGGPVAVTPIPGSK